MKKYIIIVLCLIVNGLKGQENTFKDLSFNTKIDKPIQVLNIGTFHMGYTPDAHSTDFDEHNKQNAKQVHDIAKKIAAFKPIIIIVETTPSYNPKLQDAYSQYLNNPKMSFKNPSEIELLAYEVGRLSGTKNIYGIDHRMGYNYMIGNEVKNSKDQNIVNGYYQQADSLDKIFESKNPTVLERLILTNQPFYLDFIININADLLTHISTAGNFEGADEATKFYQRNLRMYSNRNEIW